MIDYLDGKLTAVEVSELLLFIEQNPDLKKEFELLDTTILSAEKETIDASFLKKPIYAEVKNDYEEKLISNLEGELNRSEKLELEKAFTIYPELKVDAEFFSKTKIVADKHIVFENKNALKKAVPLFRSYQNYLWRAAAVLVISGLAFFFLRAPQDNFVAVKTIKIPDIIRAKENDILHAQTSKEKTIASVKTDTKNISVKKHQHKNEQPIEDEILVVSNTIHFETIEQKGLQQIILNEQEFSIDVLPAITYHSANSTVKKKPDDRFKNLQQLAEENLSNTTRDVLIEQNKPDSIYNNSTLSNVGLLFVKLYNKTTGDDAKVVKKYNNSGKVIGYAIVAANFQFATGK
jgi:hypothetical protein